MARKTHHILWPLRRFLRPRFLQTGVREGTIAVHEVRQTLDRMTAAAQAADEKRFRRLLETSATEVRDYLLSLELEGTPPGFTACYVGDAFQRFLHTLQFVPLPAGSRILEIGANPYFFHLLLRRLFPASTVE